MDDTAKEKMRRGLRKAVEAPADPFALHPEGPRGKRCPRCHKHPVAIPPEDTDAELEEALILAGAKLDDDSRVGRWVCGCSLRLLLTGLREAGWEELPAELLAEVSPTLGRVKIPRRTWPTQFMRPEGGGAPWLASATWTPEWVVRVMEIRMEGMFTRMDGRLWLNRDRLRAVLSLWHTEPELVAASLTLYRTLGPEAFARFVLTRGGRIADADLDEA